MDAQNKWSGARKVMKEIEFRRVLSSQLAKVCVCAGQEGQCDERRRGNALEAILRAGMKRTLNAVVEVRYTTGSLEVAG
jgi:hypothetical protein